MWIDQGSHPITQNLSNFRGKIGLKVACIKLFDKNMIDSQLLHFTISNLWDLEPQLYRLWIEVTGVLKDYVVNGHLMAEWMLTRIIHHMISFCIIIYILMEILLKSFVNVSMLNST